FSIQFRTSSEKTRRREQRGVPPHLLITKRTASSETPATTEDAPASSPHGCRRKRAIITYARRPSKAYRSVSLTSSRRIFARGGAGASGAPELLAASRSTSAVTLLFSDQ